MAGAGGQIRVSRWSLYLLKCLSSLGPAPCLPPETHLVCSSLQLTALGGPVCLFFLLLLPEPLLPPSAELSLWLHWPAVILIPTLHVTGRACEL